MPPRATVRSYPCVVEQGVLWVWPASPEQADPRQIPTVDALDGGGCRSIDYATDLPYDQEFLVENVLDYAHIHIAHDGVRGGGVRQMAAALSFEISNSGREGFSARIRRHDALNGAPNDEKEQMDQAVAHARFRAPTLVSYESKYDDPAKISGLALYCLPLDHGHCRLLYRAYSNFWPLRDRIRPRWMEHWHQNRLLAQDMAVVIGQAEELRKTSASLSDMWLPLRTSDQLVLEYRQWIDEFDHERTEHLGFRRRGPDSIVSIPPGDTSTLNLHTSQCSSCSRALEFSRRATSVFLTMSFALLLAAALTQGVTWPTIFGACSGVTMVAAAWASATARRFIGADN